MKIEEQLEVALAEFKASYLEKITQWSKEQVERNIERRNAYKRMVLTPENRNQYYAEQRWVYSSPFFVFDIDKFLSRSLRKAESELEKLTSKIVETLRKYDVELDSAVTVTFRMINEMSFHLTIKDGKGTIVNFKNTLAWGGIQRPHYRLIHNLKKN